MQRGGTRNRWPVAPAELEAMLDEAESWQEEFDAASSAALRPRLSAADEVHESRNVVSTWRALEADSAVPALVATGG